MAINIPIVSTFDDKGLNTAQKALSAFGVDANKGFSGLTKSTLIAGAAIAGAATAVGAFAYSAIQSASDFNEAISKNTVVFGAISKEIETFARTANTALGLSETAALKAAGTFAIFGKSAGLAGKDLSDFAIELVTLASDLASFSNTSVDDAINALGSALRGEAEPLRKYGVLLDDTTLKAAATELGIYSGSKALTAQQKVLAAQRVIFLQTADAQGDFSRTSDGLAAQQKILGATFDDIQQKLGQAFLPIFLNVVTFLNDNVVPAFERVATVIGEQGLVKGLQQAVAEMGSAGPSLVNGFKNIAVNAARMANVVYKSVQLLAAQFQFITLNPLDAIKTMAKVFDNFIDVGKLEASFNSFIAGVGNMASASGYSSFAAKKLAEDAKSAAKMTELLGDKAGGGKGDGGAAKKIKAMADRIKEASAALNKQMAEALDKAKDRLKEAQEEFDNFSTSVSDVVKSGLDFGKAFEENSQKMADSIKEASAALEEEMSPAIDNAKDKLKKAQEGFNNFGKTIFNVIKGSLDFGKAFEEGGEDAGLTFFSALQKQADKAKEFGGLVKELLATGLSEEALQQVIDAGVDSGAAIAKELLQSSENILRANKLVAETDAIAEQISNLSATKFYGAGVTNAQEYLTGVQEAMAIAQAELNESFAEGGTNAAVTFLTALQAQATKASEFAELVKQLLAAGLSQEALQQVIDAGIDSGSVIAKELLKSTGNVLKANNLVAETNAIATAIGTLSASKFYAAGVSNAQQYLAGVEAAIAVAQAKLGVTGIKLADVKAIGAGFNETISQTPTLTIPTVDRTTIRGGTSAGNVTINVTGGLATTAETAVAVNNAMLAYNRLAGPSQLAVA